MVWRINEDAAQVDALECVNSSNFVVEPQLSVNLGTYSFSHRIGRQPGTPIAPMLFREMATYVEKLMGEHLVIHLKKYRNAQKRNSETFVPHRLVYLYDRMVESLDLLQSEPPTADIVAFIELYLFQTLVEDFKSGAAWNAISQELNEKDSFVHMLTLLAFLKLQRLRGTIAKIVPATNESRKSADAVMFTPLYDRVDVEIKSPKLLCSPNNLTADQAERVIRNAWRKAKGQIGTRPSILVIGGIYVPKASLALLEAEAKRFLERRKNTDVAFIVLLSVTTLIDNPILSDNNFGVGPNTSVGPQIATREVPNPHYEGAVNFYSTDREIPGLKRHGGELRELRLGYDD